MEIKKINIDGNEYRLFKITVFKNTQYEQDILVAEEKLNSKIMEYIEKNRYQELKNIDETYSYYVPQEIADDEVEHEIIDSIESVMFCGLFSKITMQRPQFIPEDKLKNYINRD